MDKKMIEKIAKLNNMSFDGCKTVDDGKEAYDEVKKSAYRLAKVCYYLAKVESMKEEDIASKIGCSNSNVGKHINNISFMIDKFGTGIDDNAGLYSISKIDLARKCINAGCYKGKSLEEVLSKKRPDMEKALAKKSGNNSHGENKANTTAGGASDSNEEFEEITEFDMSYNGNHYHGMIEALFNLIGEEAMKQFLVTEE